VNTRKPAQSGAAEQLILFMETRYFFGCEASVPTSEVRVSTTVR
jgi:hypothetical protein